MRIFLVFILISLTSFSEEIGIVAVIDNEPITTIDIKNRTRILKELDPSIAKLDEKSRNQMVLQTLIQEGIKRAYARRVDIKASEESIETGIQHILKQKKIARSKELESLTEAEIIWHTIIEKYIAPSIHISEAEIQNAQKIHPKKTRDDIANGIFQVKLQNAMRDFISKATNTIYFEIL